MVTVEKGAQTLATFTYDALSCRVSKTNADGIIFYYHDGYWVIEEYSGNDSLLRNYIQGRYLDEMVQMKTPTDTYYYHGTVQGSITAITNQSGRVVERMRYGDFGHTEILNAAGQVIPQSSIGNTFSYTGRRLDVETGYYYYRARYYDPNRG